MFDEEGISSNFSNNYDHYDEFGLLGSKKNNRRHEYHPESNDDTPSMKWENNTKENFSHPDKSILTRNSGSQSVFVDDETKQFDANPTNYEGVDDYLKCLSNVPSFASLQHDDDDYDSGNERDSDRAQSEDFIPNCDSARRHLNDCDDDEGFDDDSYDSTDDLAWLLNDDSHQYIMHDDEDILPTLADEYNLCASRSHNNNIANNFEYFDNDESGNGSKIIVHREEEEEDYLIGKEEERYYDPTTLLLQLPRRNTTTNTNNNASSILEGLKQLNNANILSAKSRSVLLRTTPYYYRDLLQNGMKILHNGDYRSMRN